MSMLGVAEARTQSGSFRHEALFYSGVRGFLDGTVPFIRAGLEAREPILVVVDAKKIDRLRKRLGSDTDQVVFRNMSEVGSNPARIIPAWMEFVAEHAPSGRPFRGIGEPIWPQRTQDQLVECERHEALLNLAFANSPAWWLLCPYDVTSLAPEVLAEAQRNHAFVAENGGTTTSATFRSLDEISRPFDQPLPEPSVVMQTVPFCGSELAALRRYVGSEAQRSGLTKRRMQDLVMAVNEIATNSIRHGGGNGELRMWTTSGSVVVEVRDRGRIDDPLVGRRRPALHDEGGIGMWLANQLCDLVQVRTLPDGTVVRLHMAR